MQIYQRPEPEINLNGNILVVEDQDAARESLAELWRGEGYEVYEGPDGTVAKDLINKHDLDVILTDLMMPGADGIEAGLPSVPSPEYCVINQLGDRSKAGANW